MSDVHSSTRLRLGTWCLAAVLGCGGSGETPGDPDPDGGPADAGNGGEDGGTGEGDAGDDPGDAGDGGSGDPSPARVYFKASNPQVGDRFGQAVAIDGDLLAVGAPNEDSDARGIGGDQENDRLDGAGAVYVFRREGGAWVQEAYIKAVNPGESDAFGQALALDGDLLAIGVPAEDSAGTGVDPDPFDDDAPASGAVTLYRRGADGWAREAFLKGSNTGARDNFGGDVAIDGDVVVIGARAEDSRDDPALDDAEDAGAVYVFRRDPVAGWREEALLKADVVGADDRFGDSVDLAGDLLVVGASGEDSGATTVDGDPEDDEVESSGAAYVFRRGPDGWTQEAYLKPPNPGFLDAMGISVALDGDRVVAGAFLERGTGTGVDPEDDDDFTGAGSGAAHVFVLGAEGWAHEAYLKASNTGQGDAFGSACDLRGRWIACSAPAERSGRGFDDPNPDDDETATAGAVYRFFREDDGWAFVDYVKPRQPVELGLFGAELVLTDGAVLVGHPGESSSATGVDGDDLDLGAAGSGAALLVPHP